jgi:hypothetical protein
MLEYTLIVSNIGTVFTGKADAHTMSAKEMDQVKQKALDEFRECVELSKRGIGRIGGESVTLFLDDQIVREFIGANQED